MPQDLSMAIAAIHVPPILHPFIGSETPARRVIHEALVRHLSFPGAIPCTLIVHDPASAPDRSIPIRIPVRVHNHSYLNSRMYPSTLDENILSGLVYFQKAVMP